MVQDNIFISYSRKYSSKKWRVKGDITDENEKHCFIQFLLIISKSALLMNNEQQTTNNCHHMSMS